MAAPIRMLRTLFVVDARNTSREAFLVYICLIEFVYAIPLRFVVPAITRAFEQQFDLVPYYPLIAGYMLMITVPVFFGMATAFLLLDERDSHLIEALMVTPMPLPLYLGYRIGMPAVLSVAITLLVVPVAGIVSVPLPVLLPVALVMGLGAPLVTLFIASIAENKVQGFAIVKFLGAVALAPVAAWFVPAPWQHVAGLIYPGYWPVRAYWAHTAGESGFWIYLAVGVVAHAIGIALVLRRFLRVVHA
jgi:hypothetical protein